MLRFSVVIPTYNYAHFIARAIESVLANPGDDYEVIVVDDGSTDNTAAAVERFDRSVRYVRQENRGPSAARNRGAQAARGEYVLFLDADDRLLPDALPALRQFLAAHPDVDLACGGYASIALDGQTQLNHPPGLSSKARKNFRRLISGEISIVNGSAAIRRSALDRLRFPEQCRHFEDIVFFGHAFALLRAATVPKTLVECHDHTGRLRRNTCGALATGTLPVDLLFDPAILPEEFAPLRSKFLSRRLLSLFRTHYLRSEYVEANAVYLRAIRVHPSHLLRQRYLSKFLRSLAKHWFTSKRSGLAAPMGN